LINQLKYSGVWELHSKCQGILFKDFYLLSAASFFLHFKLIVKENVMEYQAASFMKTPRVLPPKTTV
jgi:hypothetical protein